MLHEISSSLVEKYHLIPRDYLTEFMSLNLNKYNVNKISHQHFMTLGSNSMRYTYLEKDHTFKFARNFLLNPVITVGGSINISAQVLAKFFNVPISGEDGC